MALCMVTSLLCFCYAMLQFHLLYTIKYKKFRFKILTVLLEYIFGVSVITMTVLLEYIIF